MKQFAVVQHTYSEFLGLIENQLEKRDIGFAYFRPFVGQDLPGSAGQFDALFVLGGQATPSDQDLLLALVRKIAHHRQQAFLETVHRYPPIFNRKTGILRRSIIKSSSFTSATIT